MTGRRVETNRIALYDSERHRKSSGHLSDPKAFAWWQRKQATVPGARRTTLEPPLSWPDRSQLLRRRQGDVVPLRSHGSNMASPVELAGFEPATSWVRSAPAVAQNEIKSSNRSVPGHPAATGETRYAR